MQVYPGDRVIWAVEGATGRDQEGKGKGVTSEEQHF